MASNNPTTSSLIMKAPPNGTDDRQYAPAAKPGARRRILIFGALLLAVLLPTFISLGLWQWQKAETKAILQASFDQAGELPAAALPAGSADAESLRYRHFAVSGHYDAGHQVLLDNRLQQGVAGYHVLTPLRLPDGRYLIVNRGWLPAPPDHTRQPAAPVPEAIQQLTGIAVPPPARFFNLAAQPTQGWSPVWQNLDLARFRSVLPGPVIDTVLQLDASAPAGFGRDWPRPDERVERHRSYALQWFGFALASVGIWLFLLLRRP